MNAESQALYADAVMKEDLKEDARGKDAPEAINDLIDLIIEARKLAEKGRDIAWAYHKEYEPGSNFEPTPLPWEKK